MNNAKIDYYNQTLITRIIRKLKKNIFEHCYKLNFDDFMQNFQSRNLKFEIRFIILNDFTNETLKRCRKNENIDVFLQNSNFAKNDN